MDVIDIEALERQIFQTAVELIQEISRAHAMRVADDIGRAGDAGLKEGFFEIAPHIDWRRAVIRDEPSLGSDNNFIPLKSLGRKILQGCADCALASLQAIIYRAVDHVTAALNRAADSLAVLTVGLRVVISEISADTNGRHPQALRLPVVIAVNSVGKTLAVTIRARKCCCAGNCHRAPLFLPFKNNLPKLVSACMRNITSDHEHSCWLGTSPHEREQCSRDRFLLKS